MTIANFAVKRECSSDQAVPSFMLGPSRFTRHYIARWWPHFSALFAAAIAAASCAVAVQYVMKILVDALAGPRASNAPWLVLGLFMSLIVSESLLWRFSGWLGCHATVGAGVDMRADLFRVLSGHPMRYFADHLSGSLGHRITSTAGSFGALVNTLVWRVVPPCVDFIGAIVLFTFVDWRMGLVLGAFVISVTAGLIVFGERGRYLHVRYANKASDVGGRLIDVISNVWLLKAFSAEKCELKGLRGEFEEEAAAQRASWMYTERARLLHDVALWLLAGAMLAWCLKLWGAGLISPGDVVLVSALTFRILHGSRDLALAFVDIAQQFGFIQETLRVIARPASLRDQSGAGPFTGRAGSIEFRNVSFAYEPGRDAIHDLSLGIPAGQKLGIVGPSGAGKTTLIHLIQRLADPQRGVILIDHQPINALVQDSLRRVLAVVPQETTLLHRSVLQNIQIARPDATIEDVRAAATAADCDRFVRALPQGYDTIIGERGTKLSGGQRQRIGIARAFLKDALITILDEATSALDNNSEREIYKSLFQNMRDRTVITIAHRFSSVAAFDRIVVIKAGRIIEDSSPERLLGGDGMFEHFCEPQAGSLQRLQ